MNRKTMRTINIVSIAILLFSAGFYVIESGIIQTTSPNVQQMETHVESATRVTKYSEIPERYRTLVPAGIKGMDFEYAEMMTLDTMEIITNGYYIPNTDAYLQFKILINNGTDYIESSITANRDPIIKSIADVGVEIHPYTVANATMYTAVFKIGNMQYTVTSNLPLEDIEGIISDFLNK